jgi:hypothetical protein
MAFKVGPGRNPAVNFHGESPSGDVNSLRTWSHGDIFPVEISWVFPAR